jgi:hypothetical protein
MSSRVGVGWLGGCYLRWWSLLACGFVRVGCLSLTLRVVILHVMFCCPLLIMHCPSTPY